MANYNNPPSKHGHKVENWKQRKKRLELEAMEKDRVSPRSDTVAKRFTPEIIKDDKLDHTPVYNYRKS